MAIRDCGWNLDFRRFHVYLRDKYKITKAFLFIGYIEGNEPLYQNLKDAGYLLIFKPTLDHKKEGESFTKGNVDAELVLHTMIEYPSYDRAMIVSGDGDFYCLIEYLEKKAKLSHVLIPNPQKYSALLRGFRKYFIYIDQLKRKLGYRGDSSLKLPKEPPKTVLKKTPQGKKKWRKQPHKNTKKRGSNLRTEP